MGLQEQLEEAKNRVAQLERQIAQAPCAEVGHRWRHVGGACASCCPECSCSVPVHTCQVCGDSDYGENAEAVQVRTACFERYGYPVCPKCGEETDILDGCRSCGSEEGSN